MIDLRRHGRTTVVALGLFALAGAPSAGPREPTPAPKSHKTLKGKSATKAARVRVPPLRDGQAEAHLLDIYQLMQAGQTDKALEQTRRLVRDYPNFHLAQLTLGDLLASRARPLRQLGDVPGTPSAELAELRTESRQRVAAHQQQARRDPRSIPSQFLQLAPRYRHAIAVDTALSRLYLFENTDQGLRLVADYYASVGKLGIEKVVEGDQRTPLGVYFITGRLDPATLRDIYGAGALPINYPNALDQSRGKTGSGIWLHGTPRSQYSRAPLATDGCVALSNPDLQRLLRTVEPRTTPVVIARSLQWVAPDGNQARREREAFEAVLADWSRAKSAGNLQQLLSFYADDFKTRKNQTDVDRAEYAKQLKAETAALAGRALELKDTTYLRWVDAAETMIVTFGEVAKGARTGPVRRQYWTRQGRHWRIFYEGIIG